MNLFLRSFVYTTMIFLLGLFFGMFVNQYRVEMIQKDMESLKSNIGQVELEFLVLQSIDDKNLSCSFMNERIKEAITMANELGSKVEEYENSKKLDENKFLALKNDYMNALLREWAMVTKIKRECNSNYSIILYFHTKDCPVCNQQGMVLTYFKEKLGNKVQIFPFDVSVGNPIVDTLARAYNVTSYPTIVVDGQVYREFTDKETIKEKLCASYNFTELNCA